MNEAEERKSVINTSHTTLKTYCSEEQMNLITENLNYRNYRKGEVIFYEGQPSYLIYFVHTGIIKLWKEGFHKIEQIIRFSKEGDMMGFWASLENKDYSLSATALTDAKIYFIKKDILLPIVQKTPSINSILHDYIQELKKTEDELRNMAEMNVREKVAHSILELLEVFENHMDDEAIKTALSRKEISALSSISEDRISKQLSDFKKEKIITITGESTIINRNALKDIIRPYLTE
jgi:CRP/FNR family transcriptional regulator